MVKIEVLNLENFRDVYLQAVFKLFGPAEGDRQRDAQGEDRNWERQCQKLLYNPCLKFS